MISFICAFLVLFGWIKNKHDRTNGKKPKASHRGSGLLTNLLLEEGENGDDDDEYSNTYEEMKTADDRLPIVKAEHPCRIFKLDLVNLYDDERYARCIECGHARDAHRYSSEYSDEEDRYVISEVL